MIPSFSWTPPIFQQDRMNSPIQNQNQKLILSTKKEWISGLLDEFGQMILRFNVKYSSTAPQEGCIKVFLFGFFGCWIPSVSQGHLYHGRLGGLQAQHKSAADHLDGLHKKIGVQEL